MTPSLEQLAAQLRGLTISGLRHVLDARALAHGLNRSFVYAICSRESACLNILGDIRDGEPHGVGVMQIDIQHDIARLARDTGSWKDQPEPLIEFGCAVLATNWSRARAMLDDASPLDKLKTAAAGYNCGIGRAIEAFLATHDPDIYTTDANYGLDVMARMVLFDRLIGVI